MIFDIIGAAAGLVLLALAADHLVLGASRLTRRLRVTPVVVGVVVIGIGTSAPEFLVSGLAAARGDTGLAVGNIVGSNILNLTLLLGVAAIIAPIPVAARVIRREVPLAFAGVGFFGLVAVVAGLGPITAAILAVAGVATLWLLVRWARDGEAEAGEPTAEPTAEAGRTWIEAVRVTLGLLGVLAGAQLLVDGASAVAANLGVSQLVIGFTLVALGTSLPELVTSIQAQRRGESDLVVGNLFGSSLFNSLVGGAVIGFADDKTAYAGGVLVLTMVLSTGLAWILLRRGLRLTRLDGALLTVAYALVAPLLLSA
ncbi:calcium/sodium antiporter [Actinoplanes sp. NPDC026619]|uniref:calcium/sodium antiporter n=1 Tax=Actinoplanes sp. NPDC026619 TaxID=3155798 RepID=UPI0033DA5EF2